MDILGRIIIFSICLIVSFSFEKPAAALDIGDIPTACLPHRVVQNQMHYCHCPPQRLCDNPSDMPSFMRTLCCDAPPPPPSGNCTQNGCPSGWHYVLTRPTGSTIPMPLYYCDQQPNCAQIFDHIPSSVNIIERSYNYPERVATFKQLNIVPDVNAPNDTVPGEGWICDASGMNAMYGNPKPAINPQFWVMAELAQVLGGQENVCVIPAFPDGNCFNRISVSDDGIGPCVPGEDCLPLDTKVLAENGKEVLIQEVKVGDKLKSQTGVNTVLEIQITKSGERTLYSINEGKFIITEGHPLLTQRGWATTGAAQSMANASEKNWADQELKVGDLIIGKDNAIRVKKIMPLNMKDVETYNLKLSGDNSFIANGVVVQGFDSVEMKYTPAKSTKK